MSDRRRWSGSLRRRAAPTAVGVGLLLWLPVAGCGRSIESGPAAIRLVERYAAAESDAGPAAEPRPWLEWRFETTSAGEPPHHGWAAAAGIADLRTANGALTGTARDERPVLFLDDPFDLEAPELLETLEIRVRVSDGATLAAAFLPRPLGEAGLRVDELDALDWSMTTSLVPGDGWRTYLLSSPLPVDSGGVRQLLLRPTDRAGARFEIASIRPVFRRERLASIPSGAGWYGLSEVYLDSLAARAPSTLEFDVVLPSDPWLDLRVGTVGRHPVTFEVEAGIRTRDGTLGAVTRAATTVAEPDRWHELPLELAALGGTEARIRLTLGGPVEGSLGLWGGPVIRNRVRSDGGGGDRGPPQGVILVWSDSLRPDHLQLYGYHRATAPNLARLGAEGVTFTDCVAQGTWTKVSTASLLTSMYASTHGVVDFSDRLADAAITLPEVYQQAGYATLSMSSILLTGKFSNLHQGFDEVHESLSFPDTGSSKTARAYVDRLLPWLAGHRRDRFFVLLHVYDPHDPYKPEEPYRTLWADAARARDHELQAQQVLAWIQDPLLRRFGMPSRDDLARAGLDPLDYVALEEGWYDGSIRGMDDQIGRLLAGLGDLGLDESTLVVFTSDHGEEFLDHGRMFHGQGLYGELTQVPLVLWAPGRLPAGEVIEETVELVDLMPTLLELSGLGQPAGVQGDSLLPLLQGAGGVTGTGGRAPGWRSPPAFSEKPAVRELLSPPPRETEAYAVVHDGWKLIHHTRPPAGTPEFELFDHRLDPLDQIDLADRQPEVVRRLADLLADWRRKTAAERLEPEVEERLHPVELERLRALGYLATED